MKSSKPLVSKCTALNCHPASTYTMLSTWPFWRGTRQEGGGGSQSRDEAAIARIQRQWLRRIRGRRNLWPCSIHDQESDDRRPPRLYYLIHWKDTPAFEDKWEPYAGIKHLRRLVKRFHQDKPQMKPTATSEPNQHRPIPSDYRKKIFFFLLRYVEHRNPHLSPTIFRQVLVLWSRKRRRCGLNGPQRGRRRSGIDDTLAPHRHKNIIGISKGESQFRIFVNMSVATDLKRPLLIGSGGSFGQAIPEHVNDSFLPLTEGFYQKLNRCTNPVRHEGSLHSLLERGLTLVGRQL